MYGIAIGRLLRMLRLRKRWRQADVADRAGISASVIGRHENGTIGSLPALEKHAAAFGLRIEVRLVGRGGSLVRLADEEHARIVESIAAWFRACGFQTETEASFSEWGERGRIDLLASDQLSGTLVIVEVKTQLLDLQDLFGGMNVKERLATTLATRRGWSATRCVTLLAVAGTAANRRIVRDHSTLFSTFDERRLTQASLRRHARILHWVKPDAEHGAWLAGRQRVSRGGI